MADLSDKARRLLNAVKNIGFTTHVVALHDYIADLESVVSAAREHDAAVAAQERFDCNHYEPPCKCGDTAAEIDLRAEEAFKVLRDSIRRLDGAGEGDGNG